MIFTTKWAVRLTIALTTVAALSAHAQQTLVSGLDVPLKVVSASNNTLLVSEGGSGPNSGELSRVTISSGTAHTLIDGLPAGLDAFSRPTGPSDIAVLTNRRVLLLIGEADTIRPGNLAGTSIPNPDGLSSPILSSILSIRFSAAFHNLLGNFTMDLSDHFTLSEGKPVTLHNAWGETATIVLVHDQRDLVPDTTTIVRSADPIGVAVRGANIFSVDAAMNHMIRTRLPSGKTRTLVKFAPLANPSISGLSFEAWHAISLDYS